MERSDEGAGQVSSIFEFATATRIVFGCGKIRAVPDLIRNLRSSSVHSSSPKINPSHDPSSFSIQKNNSNSFENEKEEEENIRGNEKSQESKVMQQQQQKTKSNNESNSSSSSSSSSVAPTAAATIFIVTGADQSRARPLTKLLDDNGMAWTAFGVTNEPSVEDVRMGLKFAARCRTDLVIAFGGGSAIDCGKVIAALATNDGDIYDYMEVVGKGLPLKYPPLPFIAIPTTAGTGSEVTRNGVITSTEHKQKVSIRSADMLPKIALVDPELTVSMPAQVTASTGLDAFTQALEAFVSNASNPLTDALCREALRRAARSLQRAFERGDDLQAREDMCIASLFAGMALANAKLGAVHGFAGPLGGMFESPHGAVCAALLPHVIRVNVRALQERSPNSHYLLKFDEVAQLVTGDPKATSNDGVEWIEQLCKSLFVPSLATYGIQHDHLQELVTKSRGTSSMKGNPIELTQDELREILEDAL